MSTVDTLAIPAPEPSGRIEVFSGVARMSGTLWARRHRADPEQR